MAGKFGRRSMNESVDNAPADANVVPAICRAATGAAGAVVEVVGAVGAEEREALRMENDENQWRVYEGDTLWSLSEKHLGDPNLWPHLKAACRRELGPNPHSLVPGSHISEACVDRARRRASRKTRWWFFWM